MKYPIRTPPRRTLLPKTGEPLHSGGNLTRDVNFYEFPWYRLLVGQFILSTIAFATRFLNFQPYGNIIDVLFHSYFYIALASAMGSMYMYTVFFVVQQYYRLTFEACLREWLWIPPRWSRCLLSVVAWLWSLVSVCLVASGVYSNFLDLGIYFW